MYYKILLNICICIEYLFVFQLYLIIKLHISVLNSKNLNNNISNKINYEQTINSAGGLSECSGSEPD